MILLGPYLVACALLVSAGLAKARRPADTARALVVVVPRLPVGLVRRAVRVLALVEAALGAAAALFPGRPAAAGVAASYLLFAGFVVVVRRRHGPLASCGCFATPDTPATWWHAAVNLALAAGAVSVATADHRGPVASLLTRQPLAGIPLLGAVAVGTWLVFLGLVAVPRLSAVRRAMGAAPARPPAPRVVA